MKIQNIDTIKSGVVNFCQYWPITKFSLFGSVLRDDFRDESDIDVLVEFEPGHVLEFLRLHRIQEELSEIFGNRSIDLVMPKALNPRIRDRILADAEIYYASER